MRSRWCVCVCVYIYIYITAPEPTSTAYLKNPFHQSVCLYVCLPIVARQRLSKNSLSLLGNISVEKLPR
jgi:hypothetical protein